MVNYGAGFEDVGYCIDSNGYVHVKGFIKGGLTANSSLIFTLPVGYRPPATLYLASSSYGVDAAVITVLRIESNGNVSVRSAGNVWLSLNVPPFRAV